MAVEISRELADIIADKDTLKVIASIDKNGDPHVVYKGSLSVNEQGYLEYYEVIETSQTNKNLTNSIWFNKKIAINILSKDKKSFQIKGIIYKAITSGKYFEKAYKQLHERPGSPDLSTVWIITPEKIIDESFAVRLKEETERHPHIIHLDKIVKE